MNWDDLTLFLAVARSGSISGGAKLLELQHSTVSRRMHKLEEDLGVRLFEKKRNGYELTISGEKLKIAASRMECKGLSLPMMGNARANKANADRSSPSRMTPPASLR